MTDPRRLRVLRIAHHAVVDAWRERERELRRQGLEVALVSSKRWNEGGRDLDLRPGGDARWVRGARTFGRHPSVFLYDPRPIWRALAGRPDVVDLHEEPNSLAVAEVRLLMRLRGIRAPFVMYSAQNLAKRYPVPFRWFERSALRHGAGAYVCNAEAGRILTEKGLAGPARLIPLGVDVDVFTPADRDAPGEDAVVGYVGRLEAHKGVDVLLRAIALRPGRRLVITGDGPERPALERLAADLGIAERVEFAGFAADGALADRYRALDVVAVPSLPTPTWLEQFCRVAVEAMASGVPVVGSDSGAIPDVVGTAGVIVPPGDPEALAAGLDEALARWSELRAAGTAHAADFTWESVAAEQAALYRTVLGTDDAAADVPPRIVVVAYGPPDELDGCLAALDGAFEVLVVDNSSEPRTRTVAEAHGARYLDAGGNRGFAGGVNLGLAELSGATGLGGDVMLLNPDARIGPDDVRRMHAALRAAPRTAAVGAEQTVAATGEPVRVRWPFPTPLGAWIEAFGLGGLRRRWGFAIGSALLLRAEAVDALGGLDERFFLYSEETDWQYRARRAGWRIDVVPTSATHEGAGTGGDPAVRERHFYASAERYQRKHYGAAGWQAYRLANLLGAAARALVLPGERGAEARRRRDLFARGPVAALEDAERAARLAAETAPGRPRTAHVVVTDAFAGTERYVLGVALAQRAAGHDVAVVGGEERRMRGPLEAAGVRWLPGATLPAANAALGRLGGLDLLVSHMTAADLVACRFGARRGIPVVSVRHFAATRGSNALGRIAGRWIAGRLAGQIAGARFIADRVEGASRVIAPGVPSLDDDGERRSASVLVAQRFEAEKRTALALEAWALVADRGEWRLVLAGDGAERAALGELADRLGIAGSVDFVGFQADMDTRFREASVFLATAPAEPFGFSVLEAMSHGLPVVAAAGGGHLETAGSAGDAAALFAPDDAVAAARALERLIGSAPARDAAGAALRERQREAFDARRQGERLAEALAGFARTEPDAVGRLLVVVSLEAWDEVWRRNQYLVDGLLRADPDLSVLFVEPPVDPAHDARSGRRPRTGSGVRSIPGYAGRLRAFEPTKWLPRAAGPLADRLLRRSVRRVVRRLGAVRPLLWINDPRWAGLRAETGWSTLYDVTDDWTLADRPPRERARLLDGDAALVAEAEAVVVCSPALVASKGASRPVRLIANAVDLARARTPHSRPADLPDGPVALYAGTLHEDRLDVDLVVETGRALAAAGALLVLLGPVALGEANRARLEVEAGIRLLGSRPGSAVAAYLQHAEVLVVPHLVDEFTGSLDPIKRYEYRAAGRPVVAAPVAGFVEADGEPGLVVASGDGFTSAVVRSALAGTPSLEFDDVPDWSERAAAMAAVLGEIEGARGVVS
ncbi:glycosyltransferase [Agromyces seonyuensis]|uniref:Glycosyltransferase n=1 Tax=Agromyces seonyuensis TaxID=2662446 RepID=A0A6I4NSU5_9MICO|nr:glycosyltransferase [Agromyces seonyuensis]MWB97260.1 glycosyltransferase [Agromyces seonyuensis]